MGIVESFWQHRPIVASPGSGGDCRANEGFAYPCGARTKVTRKDRDAYQRVCERFIAGHLRGYEAIKAGPGNAPAGLTLAMSDLQPVPGGEETLSWLRRRREDIFLEAARGDDFIGVHTYTRTRVGPEGELGPEEGVETTTMGYEFLAGGPRGNRPQAVGRDGADADPRHGERRSYRG